MSVVSRIKGYAKAVPAGLKAAGRELVKKAKKVAKDTVATKRAPKKTSKKSAKKSAPKRRRRRVNGDETPRP
jgi:hypothetical protein